MPSLERRILDYLEKAGPVKARKIASDLGLKDKSEVNPLLYRLKTAGKTHIDADYQWSLITPAKPPSTAATKPPTAPSSTPPATPRPQATTLQSELLENGTVTRKRDARNTGAGIVWTSEQAAVVNAPADDRLLIEAGPGTGKTAVACARVAKLLSKDEINPGSILMVSFTRTAVAEMKSRIRLWADSGRVSAVNISTLDQAAFSFGIGCGQKFDHLMHGFEGNIQNAVEQFRTKNPLLAEYVATLRHVIIDEAQDLTGARSQLIRLLIESLPKTTGVTIFADEAQAIYGFSTDMDGDGETNETFLQTFEATKHGFKRSELQKIFRTREPLILKLFAESRKALLEGTIESVIQVAESAARDLGAEVSRLPLRDGDLILYRKRASALMHAQHCPKLFRLRLPNHPYAVFPWIGLAFSNWTDPLVSQDQFSTLWAQHVPALIRDGFTLDSAWALLHRFARDRDYVKTARLRALLSLPRPPVEFCYLDYGGVGPVFSTIHASKGREADRVFLMLPSNLNYLEGTAKLDRAEEARVFYVGSTRVRSEFLRGKAPTMVGAGRIDQSGRRVGQILTLRKRPKFQIGLAGDLDDVAPISRVTAFCASNAAAAAHQNTLIESWSEALTNDVCPEINATSEQLGQGPEEYRYRFTTGSSSIAWSASGLHKDLRTACRLMRQRMMSQGKTCTDLRQPDDIKSLRLIGLRTCAVGDDPAVLGNLREPFASSGFWLAPMIVGFPSIFLRFQQDRTGRRRQ